MGLSVSNGGINGAAVTSQQRGLVQSQTAQPVFLADKTTTYTYRDASRTQEIMNLSKAVPIANA